MKVKIIALSITQHLIGQSKRRAFLLTLIQSGTGKSQLANEIARELLREGKSVSKENYYAIILVCAQKREGEGLTNLWIYPLQQ